MPQATEIAVILGAAANIVLACRNALGLRLLWDRSKPLGIQVSYPRASLVPVLTKGFYLPVFFASVSLMYREELVNTPLGTAMGVGMAGYLTLIGLEHAFVPELRPYRLIPILAAVIGGPAYVYAIFGGI
jgi:hypothetical protein